MLFNEIEKSHITPLNCITKWYYGITSTECNCWCTCLIEVSAAPITTDCYIYCQQYCSWDRQSQVTTHQ